MNVPTGHWLMRRTNIQNKKYIVHTSKKLKRTDGPVLEPVTVCTAQVSCMSSLKILSNDSYFVTVNNMIKLVNE